MIRNSVINGMFREPGYTEVHEQINIDHSDFRERMETPGYTVSDTNLAIHDPETDSLYRGLYLRIVSLNSNGSFDAPNSIQYDSYLFTILSEIKNRLSISSVIETETNEAQILCNDLDEPQSLLERIVQHFHPLIPYSSTAGLFQHTSALTIIDRFNQPTQTQQTSSYLQDTTSDWSLNRSLYNVLSHYRPQNTLELTYENHPYGIRRRPRLKYKFIDALRGLRLSRQNLASNIRKYIEEAEMHPDETKFLMQLLSLENIQRRTFNRSLNIQRQQQNFITQHPEIQVIGNTNITIPLPVNQRYYSQIQSYLTTQQSTATTQQSEVNYQNHFQTSLESREFNFHRFTSHLRNLFRRAMLENPTLFDHGSTTEKRSLAFITTLKSILLGLEHEEFLAYEEDLLNLNRGLDTIVEDSAFYFSNYLLLHIELNQYARFLKAIIQYSNLENKEELSI